jgi:hypothetical protein
MTLISVPRPPKSAYNPDRPVSALLKAQMDHLHQAERKLPLRYHSAIYINAVRTEGEAARYIRDVTEAIHAAHEEAAEQRRRRVPRRKRGLEIAAVADVRAERKSAPKRKTSSAEKADKKTSSAKKKSRKK